MTPAQLEHLKRIDAHLTNLLAIAEKRTPGEWRRPGWLPDSMYLGSSPDSAFIASCAGNAEAGWKYALKNLRTWQRAHDEAISKELKSLAAKQLESILAAWPLELLKIFLATSAV